MVGGAAPHDGWPQVAQEGYVGRAGESGTTWAGGERRRDGRTVWQRMVWCLATREIRSTAALSLDPDLRFGTAQ